jgi:methanogenic corrinoid protein MtbC1
MKVPNVHQQLISELADLNEEVVLQMVQERLEAGDDPLQIIEDCNTGMRLVGERYEQGEFYISGLIMSGEIFREVVELVQPYLKRLEGNVPLGCILLGTVAGDIHDIGKNLVSMLLACHGFNVIDLGVDVPASVFAMKAAEVKPDIVGLSGLLTASFDGMKETVILLRDEAAKSGLSLPIMIGGGLINDQICQYVNADYWAPDAMSGVRLCQHLLGKLDAAG